MVMRSEVFFPIFSTVEESYFLGEVFAQSAHEFLEVCFIERVIVGHIVTVFKLLWCAFVFASVCEGDEAIAVKIDMQSSFVGDSHSPQASPIKTATEALATSHFQFLRGS